MRFQWYQKPLSGLMVLALLLNTLIPVGYMPGDLARGQSLVVPCPSYFGAIAYPLSDNNSAEPSASTHLDPINVHSTHRTHHHQQGHHANSALGEIDHNQHHQSRSGEHFCLFAHFISIAISNDEQQPHFFNTLLSSTRITTYQRQTQENRVKLPPTRAPPSKHFNAISFS